MDLSVPRAQHIEIYNLSFSHVAETFDMHGTKMTGFLLPSSLPVVRFFLIKNVMYNFKFWKAIHFLHQKGIRVQMPLGNPSLDVKQLQNQANMHPIVKTVAHWYILESLSISDEFWFTDALSLYQRAYFNSDSWTYREFMYQQSCFGSVEMSSKFTRTWKFWDFRNFWNFRDFRNFG